MLLSILLSTVGATSSQAQKMVAAENTANAMLPVKSISETTDGVFNFKDFEIEASEEGDYYAGFWLLPSKYQDASSESASAQSGLYIINVETTKDVYSNKVVVK